MTGEITPISLNFSQAYKYLELSPEELIELRRQRLVACINQNGQQVYPLLALSLTRQLLQLGKTQGWGYATLAWYADLVFATEVGRAILLPIANQEALTRTLPSSWLETPYVSAVLQDLEILIEETEGPLITLLCSLIAAGSEQLWPDETSLKADAIYPIVAHFEATGVPILGQEARVTRDAGAIFAGMIYAFTMIAPPLSPELAKLIETAHTKLSGSPFSREASSEDQTVISQERLIAVDKLYASKATEIHSPPETWKIQIGMLIGHKETISFQVKLPLDTNQDFIDNVIDLVRPFLGGYGARVIHLLYEIANDSPYWRNPLITIDTNEVLDRLGLRRDSRGFHYSRNRERLRDTLNAAHNLEVVGEHTTRENNRLVRKIFRRTILSLVGATFDAEESRDLSTNELLQRGLPRTIQVRLNFYDGVRRPDGRLGNQYMLVPRLAEPHNLPKANYAETHELLRAYLLFRYRQTHMKSRTISVARKTALEKANITNKNITRATQTLVRALNKLLDEGTLEHFSEVPIKANQSFTVMLSPQAVMSVTDLTNQSELDEASQENL